MGQQLAIMPKTAGGTRGPKTLQQGFQVQRDDTVHTEERNVLHTEDVGCIEAVVGFTEANLPTKTVRSVRSQTRAQKR